MTRDADFSVGVKRTLPERAGYKCSVPYCNKPTVGPGATVEASASVGTACHIYSAAEGGARGTGGLSIEERQSIENGIWCCATHGRLIDTNEGKRFPAPLLKQWKRLHEARIDREISGAKTPLGWVNRLEVINSSLFEPSVRLQFSKATLIRGGEAVGKSAICEWLAGFVKPLTLERWREDHHDDIRLEYFSPEPQTLRLEIADGEVRRYWGASRLVDAPRDLNIIYLPAQYDAKRWHDYADDLAWIASIFAAEREDVKHLCEDIRINGDPLCRNMEFREEHEEEEERFKRDGWYLYVDSIFFRDGVMKEKFVRLGLLATSEVIITMVQFAAALARLRAIHAPTLLVLDGSGWNWSEELFDSFAPFLANQPYQVVLTHACHRPLNLLKQEWTDWQAVEIKHDSERERSQIVC